MKKTLAVICMAVFCCSSLMAQFNWGIRGGLNMVNNDLTKVSGDGLKSKDSYTGFFFGPMAEFQIPVIGIGIDAAVLYQQKGMEMDIENISAENVKQQQIAIPVYLKYTLGLGNMLGIFAQAGPQLNYNIGDLTQVAAANGGEEIKYVLNQNTWSFNIGAGAKLFNHFQAAVNWNMPITKEGSLESYASGINLNKSLAKIKQSVLQLSATYTF